MSLVSNVILSVNILDEHLLSLVDDWLPNGTGADLNQLPGAIGGTKALEATIRVGAFNYFDEDGYLAFLSAISWQYPEDVQILIQRQDENRWSELPWPPAQNQE